MNTRPINPEPHTVRPPLREISGFTVALPQANVDTDRIIPARFLTTTVREGLGRHLFADWRFDASGTPRPEFPLHRPETEGATVLVAGENFGCGSSREHAVWALADYGFRAVVSHSFADIFRQNALKNGLVPVTVPADVHRRLLASAPQPVTVDVAAAELRLADGTSCAFPLDPFARHCLVNGLDELAYLMAQEKEIARFEQTDRIVGSEQAARLRAADPDLAALPVDVLPAEAVDF
jgi:3-isopropylmalate/(R)-2-methylmalate dehydratase small subunit